MLANIFFDEVRKGARAEAKRLGLPEPDWVAPAQGDPAQQASMIQDLINRGVDGIAISPNAPDSIIPVVKEALEKKIPVICFDSDAPQSGRLAYVGTDNYKAGKIAGQEMVKVLKGKGKVLVVSGGKTALNLNQRIEGFKEGLRGSQVEIVSIQYCDDKVEKAHTILQDYLRGHPDTAGVFAVGGWAVLAAGPIFNQMGLKGRVKIVGFDTLKEELDLLQRGVVQVLVGQRPYQMGVQSLRLLYDLYQGKKLDREIYDTGVDIVTSQNLQEYLAKQAQ